MDKYSDENTFMPLTTFNSILFNEKFTLGLEFRF